MCIDLATIAIYTQAKFEISTVYSPSQLAWSEGGQPLGIK